MTSLLDIAPVIPVVVIHDVDLAVPLAAALARGGVGIIEVTLRSAAALDAIRAIAQGCPDVTVGAGTVCTSDQAQRSVDAGADFLVSPGTTDQLLDAFQATGLPFLAGTSTPSDLIRLAERDITEAKFFPAVASGAVAYLRAVAGPFPHLRFCPTGGITAANAPAFLAESNVGCVGASWLTPDTAVAARDWPAIEQLARDSLGLGERRR